MILCLSINECDDAMCSANISAGGGCWLAGYYHPFSSIFQLHSSKLPFQIVMCHGHPCFFGLKLGVGCRCWVGGFGIMFWLFVL